MICPHHTCGSSCCFACTDRACKICEGVERMSDRPDQLLPHAEMFVLGGDFGIRGLSDLAEDKFRQACRQYYDTPDFEDAVEYICQYPANGLRHILVGTIAANTDLIGKHNIEELLRKDEGSAYEVLK
ncbi:hypothetical protein EK21DRAFT_81201 [Setomelanomma holmii]|uniref:Uncharacterized protein n=1 Tax=Setomelanomma holmii TaxID=210430 RepID=A0A9P4GXH5_9PLEO|nr:hypothetical protein EK21DRAFT_81201 [Setomelanomma holmii]